MHVAYVTQFLLCLWCQYLQQAHTYVCHKIPTGVMCIWNSVLTSCSWYAGTIRQCAYWHSTYLLMLTLLCLIKQLMWLSKHHSHFSKNKAVENYEAKTMDWYKLVFCLYVAACCLVSWPDKIQRHLSLLIQSLTNWWLVVIIWVNVNLPAPKVNCTNTSDKYIWQTSFSLMWVFKGSPRQWIHFGPPNLLCSK